MSHAEQSAACVNGPRRLRAAPPVEPGSLFGNARLVLTAESPQSAAVLLNIDHDGTSGAENAPLDTNIFSQGWERGT